MISIIHICGIYTNIEIFIYKNVYFGLGLGGFQVEFDNIYTLSIIHQVRIQKIPTHSGRVGIH